MSMVKVSALPTKLPWVEGVDYTVIAGAPQYGDKVRITDNTGEVFVIYTHPGSAPPVSYAPLSKTAFQEHVIAQLMALSGLTRKQAAGRFDKILKTARTSNDDAVAFAYQRYTDATTFNKSVADEITQWMVDDGAPNSLTASERSAVSNNWPTA